MSPDEFLSRVLAAADDAAFRLSHTPRDCQSAWLRGFERRVKAKWRSLFAPVLSAEDIDGMIADLLVRIRAKRDRLERFGGGTA